MKRILPLLTFLLLFSFSLFSQTDTTVEDSYTEYFKLPRETLFLHLNKTSFLAGEEIWFKGYAYDQKNQLTSKATTNFNVGIYDANGKEVKRALFQGENGVTRGNFLVDSTFVSGTYYIKAATNWMKNFQDDGAYIQKIEIFGDKIIGNNEEATKNEYDFQFLPEGGHIVANAKNNIGFKVVNANGKGVSATGIIFNEKNEEVTKFKSNTLGLGKFLFQPKVNEKYTSKITLATGETIEQKIQATGRQGITIIMNTLFPDRAIITLNTNEETLKNHSNTKYKLLIHQSGKLKTVSFTFDQGIAKTITIPKNELFKGVNTVTLFDENEQPILERLFFNDLGIKKTNVSVSKLNKVNDSIILSVKELNLDEEANISVSMLPEETESYTPNNTIISSFLLQPYVKGIIENPEYYFTNFDRKQKYELDILLLTQGWSKYNWDAIFRNPPKQLHQFENGITIKGKVNSPASGIKKLFLYSTKNHQAQFIELNEDQTFTLRNFYLEEGEEIRFSYQDKRGIFKKPRMYVTFSVTNKENSLDPEIEAQKVIDTKVIAPNFDLSKEFFREDSVELDAIVLETKRKKREEDPIAINGKFKRVDVQTYAQFPFVADYIQNNGYRVTESFGQLNITTRNRISFQGVTSPLVFLDDMPLTNFNILYNYSMANVEKILIDKSGFGYGLRSAGGVIKIYTRTTPLYKDKDGKSDISNGTAALFAFQQTKEYYAPKYNNYGDSTFKKYGVISWIPELILTKNETTTFKVFDTRTKFVTVFIEGITKDGNLISQKQTINLRE
ncbi:hypothetical protein [uncultured Kordia sp.]|uniref:hypothetical protein n=1 Tax=uncultured Kordia sp. TaxID=507699 RepID=UPI0026146C2B|nr:hypothetical protein [uncultured Kordia sp.]